MEGQTARLASSTSQYPAYDLGGIYFDYDGTYPSYWVSSLRARFSMPLVPANHPPLSYLLMSTPFEEPSMSLKLTDLVYVGLSTRLRSSKTAKPISGIYFLVSGLKSNAAGQPRNTLFKAADFEPNEALGGFQFWRFMDPAFSLDPNDPTDNQCTGDLVNNYCVGGIALPFEAFWSASAPRNQYELVLSVDTPTATHAFLKLTLVSYASNGAKLATTEVGRIRFARCKAGTCLSRDILKAPTITGGSYDKYKAPNAAFNSTWQINTHRIAVVKTTAMNGEETTPNGYFLSCDKPGTFSTISFDSGGSATMPPNTFVSVMGPKAGSWAHWSTVNGQHQPLSW